MSERRRNTGVFVAIILVDLLIIVWGWNQLRARKEGYDGMGLDMAAAPKESPALPPPPAPVAAPAPRPEGGLSYLVKEEVAAPPAAEPRRPAARAAAPAREREESGPLVRAAKSYFYGLKNSARFRESKVLRQWERDFLADSQLRAINERYQGDRNAVSFIGAVVRAPGFARIVSKHLPQPDVQLFIMQMTASRSITGAAGIFLKDAKVEETINRLELPGVGSLGRLRGEDRR